jgi:outer membrane protein OmpA-like peptidoglycan-associated protein
MKRLLLTSLLPLLLSFVTIASFVPERYEPTSLHFPRCMFEFKSTVLSQGTKDSVLNFMSTILKNNPTVVIQLDGHCSPDEGSNKTTTVLSLARANACRDYLILQGIDSARVKAKGWGTTMTLPGCSAADVAKMKTKEEKEEAYKEDRRVEFRLLSFNYVPKGGYSHEDSLQIKKLQNIGTGK